MEKINVPGVGMRMVKTAVAVVLCYFIFLPFWLRMPVGEYDPLKDVGPFYACIAAVICMQSSVAQSVRQGVSRVIGTCIGGLVGLVILFVDDLVEQPIFLGLMIGMGIVLTMWICNLIRRPSACSIGSVLVCVVILNHGGPERYFYTLFRVMETIVGIVVAVGINHLLPDRRKDAGETE
ncbi:aromatic acid exporter family protein [Pseudoflavonifractor intestinihominis]|uniref:FUSC family protein n=1 Tax=Pseudoflavonifractor intestinihominis TaxID=3133171 RepID=A0ABV1E7A5_9FIRM|nr:FUSC family protein [uncultured Pseudoflavonifractor sp.]